MKPAHLLLVLAAGGLAACDAPPAPPSLRDVVAAAADTAAFDTSGAGVVDLAGADTLAVAEEPFETVTPDAPPARAPSTRRPAPADSAPSDSAPSDSAPAEPADGRYALLVGIDDYPGDEDDLPSGHRDVDAMRRLLVERFGFRPERVLTLRDAAASRGAIRQAFAEHLSKATGTALFYFSGHGVRLDENAGRADDEADGRDEAIYTWGEGGAGALVLDDELGAWLGALGADRVLTILDACHSGTGTRAASADGPRAKEVALAEVAGALDPAAPWDAPAGSAATAPLARRRPAGAAHVLLAAAADREQALSGADGEPSVFTAALVAVLGEAPPGRPLADAMREVTARVRTVSRNYGAEHTPQAERAGALTLGDLLGR